MQCEKIDHISIAVRDVKQAEETYGKILGIEATDHYVDEREQIRVARFYVGESALEVMESTSPHGEVARFIDRRGEGVFLISLKVPNAEQALRELQSKGVRLIDHTTRRWRHSRYFFLHPAALNGVLLELID